MSQKYEATGQIKIIEATQSFPSGFAKREFVITTDNEKYPQYLKFEVVKANCEKLDQFGVGDTVTVAFNLRGNEYNGKYYVGLTAWKVTNAEPGRERTPASDGRGGGQRPESTDQANDIPF